jgi:FAD:protein FMN transferase
VEAWGFGRKKHKENAFVLPDSNKILELKKLVGFDKIKFDENSISKTNKNISLDFGGIAGGYAVDIVTEILEKRNIHNYMVEIGGELVAKGKNAQNELWKLAITNPHYKRPNEEKIFAVIEVQDRAMNTSGNYENFYEKNGKKYAHTINPQTGFPENNSLLSATIFAKDCMTADGYATACMVMGKDKSIEFLKKHKELGAYLIYTNEQGKLETYITEDIKPFVKK